MEDNNRNLILAVVLSMLVVLVLVHLLRARAASPRARNRGCSPGAAGALPQSAMRHKRPPGPPRCRPARRTLTTAARVKIKSDSLSGSISLAGGRVDDLLLTKYHETLEANSPYVRLLTPTDSDFVDTFETGTPIAPGGALETVVRKPYYAVYGWNPAAGTDPAAVPNASTIWQVESGETLTPSTPITLRWDNGPGPDLPPHLRDG